MPYQYTREPLTAEEADCLANACETPTAAELALASGTSRLDNVRLVATSQDAAIENALKFVRALDQQA